MSAASGETTARRAAGPPARDRAPSAARTARTPAGAPRRRPPMRARGGERPCGAGESRWRKWDRRLQLKLRWCARQEAKNSRPLARATRLIDLCSNSPSARSRASTCHAASHAKPIPQHTAISHWSMQRPRKVANYFNFILSDFYLKIALCRWPPPAVISLAPHNHRRSGFNLCVLHPRFRFRRRPNKSAEFLRKFAFHSNFSRVKLSVAQAPRSVEITVDVG